MIDKDINIYHGFLFEDPKATEILLAQYCDKLVRLAYLYTNDSAAAENIAEATFVTLLVKQKLFEDRNKFRVYLYRTARRKCIYHGYKREFLNIVPMEDADEILSTPSFQRILAQRPHYGHLYKAMSQLPTQYSEILYFTYFDGLSVEEICEITKKSNKQILSLTSKAKTALKEILKGVPQQ